jgi:hypothetical protein
MTRLRVKFTSLRVDFIQIKLYKKLFKMESIFKMAILRFPISPCEPCTFANFKLKNSKFKILIENYIIPNGTSEFFDKLSISSEIELELGPSLIKCFFFVIKKIVSFVVI